MQHKKQTKQNKKLEATMKPIADLEGGKTGWGEFQRQRGNCTRALTTLRRKKTVRFLNSADHQSHGIQGQRSSKARTALFL